MSISSFTKKHTIVLSIYILLLVLANFFLILQFEDFYPGCLYMCMAIVLVLIPSLFLPVRAWLILWGVLLLFYPLEIACWSTMHEQLTVGFLASIWYTDIAEASEQVGNFIGLIIASLIFFAAYFFFIFRYFPNRLWLPRKLRLKVMLPILLTGFFAFPAFTHNLSFFNDFTLKGYHRVLKRTINSVYPFDFTRSVFALKRQLKKVQKIEKERKLSLDNAGINYNGSEDLLGVFIIGETSRACNWQLAGYERATNPRLMHRKNLYFFDDVFTGANFTLYSVPQLLSASTPSNFQGWHNLPFITEILQKAGFYQGWITQQSISEVWIRFAEAPCNFKSLRYSNEADKVLDELQLPSVKTFIDESKNRSMLYFHTMGGHYAYTGRYTKQYEHFTPVIDNETFFNEYSEDLTTKQRQAITHLNSFDNTIVNTDMIIDSVISFIEAKHCPAFLIYVADHGESLFDPPLYQIYHGHRNLPHYELHVPFLIWLSDEYKAQYPSTDSLLNAHKHLKAHSNSTFHTLLQLTRTNFRDLDSTQSFLSPYYKERTVRTIVDWDDVVHPEPYYDLKNGRCPVYNKKALKEDEKASKGN